MTQEIHTQVAVRFRVRAALGALGVLYLGLGFGSAGEAGAAGARAPRLWLDAATLAVLRERAAPAQGAPAPEWLALRAACEEHAQGRVQWPDGDDYPPEPGIGEGYQGDGYLHPLLELGLGTQVASAFDPAAARRWSRKGVEILVRMSAPSGRHATDPLRDSGYGIRNYGIGLALGYDWLHDALTPSQRRRVYTSLNRWLAAFDRRGFEHNFPQGNYFAGYYAAKALATEGENPSDNPSAIPPFLATSQAGLLARWGHPAAAVFHRYAREAKARQGAAARPWEEFLFWNEGALEEEIASLPLSYLSPGMNLVAARSSWDADAVWGSFSSAPYIGYSDAGEEFFDQGSLAIVRGDTPLLVNATGALVRHTPGTTDGERYWGRVYEDNFGDPDTDPPQGNRTLYNIFYVGAHRFGQDAFGPDQARTHLSRFEEGGEYVYFRGANLEDMYRPHPDSGEPLVRTWTRDIIFLRPHWFAVYDRTTAGSADADQWLAFHLNRGATEAAAPAPGLHRFDVAAGEAFAGSVFTLLPAGAGTRLVNVFDSGKVTRLEVRPPAAGAEQRWLTLFDAALAAAAVATVRRLSAADGNVQAGDVLGAVVQGEGENRVVLASAAAAEAAPPAEIRYQVPAAATRHLLLDLQPGQQYSVSVAVGGSSHTVRIVPGAGPQASERGVLTFQVTAGGEVTSGP